MLVIGTTSTETPFLPEGELPDCARLSGPRSEAESSSLTEMEDRELAKALQESASAAQAPMAPVDPNVISPSDKFTEKDVQNLISMGFARAQVMEELRKFNGDSTQATAALFAKSFKF